MKSSIERERERERDGLSKEGIQEKRMSKGELKWKRAPHMTGLYFDYN
jgi:hypothetical protein